MSRYCACKLCIDDTPPINPYSVRRCEKRLSEMKDIFDLRNMMQCRTCGKYGKKATCPPVVPDIHRYKSTMERYEMLSIVGCKYPYSDGHFDQHWRVFSTNEIHHLLLGREKELFMSGHIYAKAFIGGSCKICGSDVCGQSARCVLPHKGRVPIEATGINAFKLISNIDESYQEPPKDYFWRIGAVFY